MHTYIHISHDPYFLPFLKIPIVSLELPLAKFILYLNTIALVVSLPIFLLHLTFGGHFRLNSGDIYYKNNSQKSRLDGTSLLSAPEVSLISEMIFSIKMKLSDKMIVSPLPWGLCPVQPF